MEFVPRTFAAPSPFQHQAEKSACYSSHLHSTLFHSGFQRQEYYFPNWLLSPSAASSVSASPLPAFLQVKCSQVQGRSFVGDPSSTSQKANPLMWTRYLAPLPGPLAYIHPSQRRRLHPPPRLARNHLSRGLRDPAAAPLPAAGRTRAELLSPPGPSSLGWEATGAEWTRRSPPPGLAPMLTARRSAGRGPHALASPAAWPAPAHRPDPAPSPPFAHGLASASPRVVPRPAPPPSPAP